MATSQDLLSLHKKIALDSSYQPSESNRPRSRNTRTRSQTQSVSEHKPSLKSSSKSVKSNRPDRDHAHSQAHGSANKIGPFHKIFSLKSAGAGTEILRSNSLSFHRNKKPRSESGHLSKTVKSNPNLKLKKAIDPTLVHQYQRYMQQRVHMLQTRAFPQEVLHRLPHYRADITDGMKSHRYRPQYSRHTECDELNQAELLRAAKRSQEQTTKLSQHGKTASALRTLKKGIAAPIKPIKNLFHGHGTKEKHKPDALLKVPSDHDHATHSYPPPPPQPEQHHAIAAIERTQTSPSSLSNIDGLAGDTRTTSSTSHANLEAKFNITARDEEGDGDVMVSPRTLEQQIDTALTLQHEQAEQQDETHEFHRWESGRRDTECVQISPAAITPNPPVLSIEQVDSNKTTESDKPALHTKHSTSAAQSMPVDHRKTLHASAQSTQLTQSKSDRTMKITWDSPTPPSITHGACLRKDDVFAKGALLRSTTPSWVDQANMRTETQVLELDIAAECEEELTRVCGELKENVQELKQVVTEQQNRMNMMSTQMHQMRGELNMIQMQTQYTDKEGTSGREEEKERENEEHFGNIEFESSADRIHGVQLQKQQSAASHGSFIGSKLSAFKEKIFEEQEIVSFERSRWENLAHSLFCYFMNGLMVIFNLLTNISIFILYDVQYVAQLASAWCCCWCKNRRRTTTTTTAARPVRNMHASVSNGNDSRSHSTNITRRNLQWHRKQRQNMNNAWRERSDED